MNVYVESTWSGGARPAGTGVVHRVDDPADRLAAVQWANPLQAGWSPDLASGASRILTWSGTLGPTLFASHPPNWLTPGHEALDEACGRWGPVLRRVDARLCLRPHARHVLSDHQSCLSFLQRHEGEPFDVALAPASLLERGMLSDAEDHLTRAFQTLGGRCPMVLLHDLGETCDDEPPPPVPLGDGLLPRAVIVDLLRRHVEPATPIVLIDEKIPQQLQWLGPTGDRRTTEDRGK